MNARHKAPHPDVVPRSSGARPIQAQATDQTLRSLAHLVRDCLCAAACAIVVTDRRASHARVYRAESDETGAFASHLDEKLAKLPANNSRTILMLDSHAAPLGDRAPLNEIAHLLQTDSFVSVPLGNEPQIGRMYIGFNGDCARKYSIAHIGSLAEQAGAMIHQVLQLGSAMNRAALGERKRVSRDLHDSTIQPYVGLKLGLEALRRKVVGLADVRREVDELISMAEDSIADLRHYVGRLGARTRRRHSETLVPALQVLAKKFSEHHGIQTHVVAHADIPVTPELHDEIMHIVREGLSNIRRHTTSKQAAIRLQFREGHLVLEFVNHAADDCASPPEFYPRSIGQRTKELGGRLKVQRIDRCTNVAVELPL